MKAVLISLSESPLDSRLFLYTAAGAGLLLTPAVAEAQTIVYTNPADIVLFAENVGTSQATNIDLNGDSVVDLSAQASHTILGHRRTEFFSRGSTLFAQAEGSDYVHPLSIGQNIMGSAPGDLFPLFHLGRASYVRQNKSGIETSYWPEGIARYLGVEFKIGAATHYGWVRAQTEVNERNATLIITDWAYNSTAGAPIIAGDTGPTPTVPEPSSLALFAAGSAAALGLLRRRRSIS